jgi:RimJ/RimL family protein N-acetyltransferase
MTGDTAAAGSGRSTSRQNSAGTATAAALTAAACTQDALDCGACQVVLFTDEANPTSNAIYQRIGFRALDDRLILRFVDPAIEG